MPPKYVWYVCLLLLLLIMTSKLAFDNEHGTDVSIEVEDIDRFSKVGLGEPSNVYRLAKAFCDIDDGDYPDNVNSKLSKALEDTLSLDSMMPAPSITPRDDLWSIAEFDHKDWTVLLDNNLFLHKRSYRGTLNRILLSFAHEVRHAEQDFAAARYHAAIGTPSNDRRSYGYLPAFVIDRALADPSLPGSDEFEFGKFVFDVSENAKEIAKRKDIKKRISYARENGTNTHELYKIYKKELATERDAESFEREVWINLTDCLAEKHL